MPTTPHRIWLWPLLHDFQLRPIELSSDTVTPGGEIKAEVTVTNTGKVEGSETAFWFIHDPVASITRPKKELKHFEKTAIPAGESRVFTFVIKPERDLSYRNGKGDSKPGNPGSSTSWSAGKKLLSAWRNSAGNSTGS